ncbi:MAG: YceI family protein [Terracidiphilus sp.]|jgi:polyisoprenoid-binding protein YceI
MRRLIACELLLVFATPLAFAQAAPWVPDAAHSVVNFSIPHLSLSNVQGRFGSVAGTVFFDQSDIGKSTVNVTIDVSGVDTGESARDSVLKSSSFFDVEKYAKATFVSTSVQKTASGLTVTGNLTLRGVTKPVTLTVEGPNRPLTSGNEKLHVGFTAEASLNRRDFGIATAFPSAVVGDQVKLSIDLEIVNQNDHP